MEGTMRRVMELVTGLTIIAAALVAGCQVEAAPWAPTRPIEIVVGFGPGGGVGTIAELVGKIAAEYKLSPQPVVISYKPGANGLIATAFVSRRQGDPHVILPGGGAITVQKATGETPIDPLKDLTPLALSVMDY